MKMETERSRMEAASRQKLEMERLDFERTKMDELLKKKEERIEIERATLKMTQQKEANEATRLNKCVSKTHISPYAQLIPGGVVHGPLKGTKHICNQCFYTGNFWR